MRVIIVETSRQFLSRQNYNAETSWQFLSHARHHISSAKERASVLYNWAYYVEGLATT